MGMLDERPDVNAAKDAALPPHGAVDPAGQRTARHDRPRSHQAADRAISRMAEDRPGNRRGRRHPRYCTIRGSVENSRGAAVGSLRPLDYALDPSSAPDHLALTTGTIIKAAEFWAFLDSRASPRRRPTPWMPMPSLPARLAAGQPGDTVTVATTTGALNRFPGIDAQAWDQNPVGSSTTRAGPVKSARELDPYARQIPKVRRYVPVKADPARSVPQFSCESVLTRDLPTALFSGGFAAHQ